MPAIYEPETLILLAHEWKEAYGRPPTSQDWNPSLAKLEGRPDQAARYHDDGCWPSTAGVLRYFGKWSTFIERCGFDPARSGALARIPAGLRYDFATGRAHGGAA